MRATLLALIRTVSAIILGYGVLILASTFVQETMFHGVSYQHSPLATLIVAGMLTPYSGMLAGMVTAAIAGRHFLLHVVPVSMWIGIETTMLYTRHIVDGPLWFEAGAGIALILGVFAGAFVWEEIVHGQVRDFASHRRASARHGVIPT